MSDAIPSPPGSAEPVLQSTVIAQKQMTVWDALKEAGWWTTYDWVILVLIMLIWVTAAYWKIFGSPTPTQVISMLLLAILFKLVWLISLAFRCSYFVLKLNAEIAMLPQASARIAVAYLSGQKPS